MRLKMLTMPVDRANISLFRILPKAIVRQLCYDSFTSSLFVTFFAGEERGAGEEGVK